VGVPKVYQSLFDPPVSINLINSRVLMCFAIFVNSINFAILISLIVLMKTRLHVIYHFLRISSKTAILIKPRDLTLLSAAGCAFCENLMNFRTKPFTGAKVGVKMPIKIAQDNRWSGR
jgi:hypothetical protein